MTVSGFVCVPQHARKTYGEQYFFVNNRFMKHPYFHKAVVEAYGGLIAADVIPSYFLYFTVDPSTIDVNIHPTKTEIKFQDESDIFQILMACVKEALGKFNVLPPLDFNTEGKIEFDIPDSSVLPVPPRVEYKEDYNPFAYREAISREAAGFERGGGGGACHQPGRKAVPSNWEALFAGLKDEAAEGQMELPSWKETGEDEGSGRAFVQMKGRYVVTPSPEGLLFMDQKRAHERVLFERYMDRLEHRQVAGQKSLFPETLELSADDCLLVKDLLLDLAVLGFELGEFGKHCYAIYATPPELTHARGREVLVSLIEHYKNTEGSIRDKMQERVALSLAQAAALDYGTVLDAGEMAALFRNLFACRHPHYTADGKTILHVLQAEDVAPWFK